MVIGSLLRRLRNQGLWARGFANDEVIFIIVKYLSTVWFERVVLSLDPDKTTVILFTENRNLNEFIKPTRFGSELQLQNQVKYLIGAI
jgi:hypothetical protein